MLRAVELLVVSVDLSRSKRIGVRIDQRIVGRTKSGMKDFVRIQTLSKDLNKGA